MLLSTMGGNIEESIYNMSVKLMHFSKVAEWNRELFVKRKTEKLTKSKRTK